MADDCLNVCEVAVALGLSRDMILTRMCRGELGRPVKQGTRWRIAAADVRAFQARQEREARRAERERRDR